jgi:putative CocE/NonD family hydrolase
MHLQSQFVRERLAGKKMARQIHYYVLGAGEFRTTSTWPVPDAQPWKLHLSADRVLAEQAGAASRASHDVDLTVGTGERTRWSTQIGTPPAYGDRREIDRRLLTFDSAPVDKAMEIVGTPVVSLVLSARSDDPAVFVYLEDVAPDGRVTYVTEGMFRAIHRRPADRSSLPYDQGPAAHSFKRADAELVHPGEVMTLEFPLMPVAALIRPGHRLRLAIAGADKDWFTIYSNGQPERFDVRLGEGGSQLILPARPWR